MFSWPGIKTAFCQLSKSIRPNRSDIDQNLITCNSRFNIRQRSFQEEPADQILTPYWGDLCIKSSFLFTSAMFSKGGQIGHQGSLFLLHKTIKWNPNLNRNLLTSLTFSRVVVCLDPLPSIIKWFPLVKGALSAGMLWYYDNSWAGDVNQVSNSTRLHWREATGS